MPAYNNFRGQRNPQNQMPMNPGAMPQANNVNAAAAPQQGFPAAQMGINQQAGNAAGGNAEPFDPWKAWGRVPEGTIKVEGQYYPTKYIFYHGDWREADVPFIGKNKNQLYLFNSNTNHVTTTARNQQFARQQGTTRVSAPKKPVQPVQQSQIGNWEAPKNAAFWEEHGKDICSHFDPTQHEMVKRIFVDIGSRHEYMKHPKNYGKLIETIRQRLPKSSLRVTKQPGQNNSAYMNTISNMNKISSAINFVKRARQPFDYKAYFNKCSLNKIACVRITLNKALKNQLLYKQARPDEALSTSDWSWLFGGGSKKPEGPKLPTDADERKFVELKHAPQNMTHRGTEATYDPIQTNRNYYTDKQLGVVPSWSEPQRYGPYGTSGMPGIHVRPESKWNKGIVSVLNGEKYQGTPKDENPTPIPGISQWYDNIYQETQRKGNQPGATPAQQATARAMYNGRTLGTDYEERSNADLGRHLGKWEWSGKVDPNNLPISAQLYTEPEKVKMAVMNHYADTAMNNFIKLKYGDDSDFMFYDGAPVYKLNERRTRGATDLNSPEVQELSKARGQFINMMLHPTQEMVDANRERINRGIPTPFDQAFRDAVVWNAASEEIASDPSLLNQYLIMNNPRPAETDTMLASTVDPQQVIDSEAPSWLESIDPYRYQYIPISEFEDRLAKAYDNEGNLTAEGAQLRSEGYPIPERDINKMDLSPVVFPEFGDDGKTIIGTRWGFYDDENDPMHEHPIYEFSTSKDKIASDVFTLPGNKKTTDGLNLGYAKTDYQKQRGRTWAYRQMSNDAAAHNLGQAAATTDFLFHAYRGIRGMQAPRPANQHMRVPRMIGRNVWRYYGEPKLVGDMTTYGVNRLNEHYRYVPKIKEYMVYQALMHPSLERYKVENNGRLPLWRDLKPKRTAGASSTSASSGSTAPIYVEPDFGSSDLDLLTPPARIPSSTSPLSPTTPVSTNDMYDEENISDVPALITPSTAPLSPVTPVPTNDMYDE